MLMLACMVIRTKLLESYRHNRLFALIFSLQLSLLVLILLGHLGLRIPMLQQVLGFIYLTFVPGVLLLRILSVWELDAIDYIVYVVGLSITSVMMVGVTINTLYPALGISHPLSTLPLFLTIIAVISILCVVSHKMDNGSSQVMHYSYDHLFSPQAISLYGLIVLSIFGTYLMNNFSNNILLISLLILISAIFLVLVYVRPTLYSLAIFIMALSLLYHRSLISNYLTGSDIHLEHYICNLVLLNSRWDSTIPMTINAMLSLVILGPVYSNILNLDIIYVFKIVYPILFSLVPLGLFSVFRKQTNERIAFLSCFLFIASNSFYGILLEAARQQIAEIFFVLLIMILREDNLSNENKALLFLVFSSSLVFSHYGVAYIFMFSLIIMWLLIHLLVPVLGMSSALRSSPIFSRFRLEEREFISSTIVIFFIIFTLTWYMYLSGSVTFNAIIHVGNHVLGGLSDVLNPNEVDALNIITSDTSISRNITKYLYLITQFLIFVGVIAVLFKPGAFKFKKEYILLSLIYLAVCFFSLIVPYTSASMTTARTYHIALFFLAPFCVIGNASLLSWLSRIKLSYLGKISVSHYIFFSVFLVGYFLFNSGLVCEAIHDNPPESISLNSTIEHPRSFSEGEVDAAMWITDKGNNSSKIYLDNSMRLLAYGVTNDINKIFMYENYTSSKPIGSYVLVGLLSLRDNKIEVRKWVRGNSPEYVSANLSESRFYRDVILNSSKIYNSNLSEVYS